MPDDDNPQNEHQYSGMMAGSDDGYTAGQWLLRLVNERHRFYQEKFTALEKLVQQRFEAFEKAVNSANSTGKEAINKAELAAEKRFDAVNEFRGQLKDQQLTLLPRAEADARFKAVEEKIDAMRGTFRGGANWLWGVIAGAGLLIFAFVTVLQNRHIP